MSDQALHKMGLLLTVNHGSWGRRRKDKRETAKVLRDNAAPTGAGSFSKNLVAPEYLKPYDDIVTQIDEFFKGTDDKPGNTSPWHGELRFLPMTNFDTCMKGLRDFKPIWEKTVDDLIARLPAAVTAWKERINGLFQWSDYPLIKGTENDDSPALDLPAIRKRFKFEFSPLPVPSSGNYILDLAQEQLDQIREWTDAKLESAAEVARLEPWRRLAELLGRVVTRQKMFPELWHELHGQLDTLKRLNLGDEVFEQMRQLTVDEMATRFSPERLKEEKDYRGAAQDKAKEILTKLQGYL